MSFPQLGYPQFLSAATAQDLYGGGERPGSASAAAAAREGAAESGVNSSSVAAAAAVGSMLGMYGNPWTAAAHNYSAFLPYGGAADLALISQMGSQYDLKDGHPGGHPALPVHATQGFYPYGQYPYGDPNRAKTATRETTSTLKAWLQEHQKNPYPTKGEKIMLAIITKMTLTQVSTWFANARRRLKKENKVTWGRSAEDRDGRIFSSDNEEDEPGMKSDDDEDEEIDLETVDPERPSGPAALQPGDEAGDGRVAVQGTTEPCSGKAAEEEEDEEEEEGLIDHRESPTKTLEGHRTLSGVSSREEPIALIKTLAASAGKLAVDHNLNSPSSRNEQTCQSRPAHHQANKPKIWSLAETATSPDNNNSGSSACIRALHPPPPLSPAALNPSGGHPALLPAAHHGIYTCQIGKLHNWTSAAFLNANSLLNMRSLLGGHHAHHHHHQHHQQHHNNAATTGLHLPLHHGSSPGARRRNMAHGGVTGPGASGTEDDSDEESSGSCSPKRDEEESDHRPDSPKSSFRLIADRPHHGAAAQQQQQRILTTTL